MDVRGRKVFVGLSGGVDSAVTAAMLKERGASVFGVFIKGWYPPGIPCTWAADRRDAMRVAARLGIPFITLDASAEYKQGVIEYLLAEYKAGRTPNPDIMCNREVKFGAFYRYAKEHGADFIATGHYGRIADGNLLRGIDEGKDQSYFLWAVPKEALSMTLFPLGELHKDETRRLAQKHRLPNAAKRDSQGICFLGSVSVEDFLKEEFGENPGQAVDEGGSVVGMHNGVLLHTLGERIAIESTQPGPWYVLRKDIERNLLVIGHEPRARDRKVIELTDTNWLETPENDARYTAQYRYHGPRIEGVLSQNCSSFMPSTPITEPVASGQSLVIYKADSLVGGGIIG